jgi:hypothetical protein
MDYYPIKRATLYVAVYTWMVSTMCVVTRDNKHVLENVLKNKTRDVCFS